MEVAILWFGDIFLCHGVGPLVRIEGTMDRFMYAEILKKRILPYAKEKYAT